MVLTILCCPQNGWKVSTVSVNASPISVLHVVMNLVISKKSVLVPTPRQTRC